MLSGANHSNVSKEFLSISNSLPKRGSLTLGNKHQWISQSKRDPSKCGHSGSSPQASRASFPSQPHPVSAAKLLTCCLASLSQCHSLYFSKSHPPFAFMVLFQEIQRTHTSVGNIVFSFFPTGYSHRTEMAYSMAYNDSMGRKPLTSLTILFCPFTVLNIRWIV